MLISFPGESTEYRVARGRLLEQELELRRATEAVAEARRALPPGGAVTQDYVLQGVNADGRRRDVRFSELFQAGTRSLVIYSFMFPRPARETRDGPVGGESAAWPLAEGPCPSCVALLDQLDGVVPHASQRVNAAAALVLVDDVQPRLPR